MTKIIKVSLWCVAAGLLAIVLMFAYYHFDVGVEPCKGLPSDASNCADADLGGVYFILAAALFFVIGFGGLVYSAIKRFIKR